MKKEKPTFILRMHNLFLDHTIIWEVGFAET